MKQAVTPREHALQRTLALIGGGGGRGQGGTGNRAETKAEVRRWRCRLARVEGEEGAGVKVEKLRMLGKSQREMR